MDFYGFSKSDIIAILGIVVTIILAIIGYFITMYPQHSNKLAKKQLENLEAEEKNKLATKLKLSIQPSRRNHCFNIVNVGNTTTYNLNFKFINNTDNPLFTEVNELLPHPELKPGDNLALRAAFLMIVHHDIQ